MPSYTPRWLKPQMFGVSSWPEIERGLTPQQAQALWTWISKIDSPGSADRYLKLHFGVQMLNQAVSRIKAQIPASREVNPNEGKPNTTPDPNALTPNETVPNTSTYDPTKDPDYRGNVYTPPPGGGGGGGGGGTGADNDVVTDSPPPGTTTNKGGTQPAVGPDLNPANYQVGNTPQTRGMLLHLEGGQWVPVSPDALLSLPRDLITQVVGGPNYSLDTSYPGYVFVKEHGQPATQTPNAPAQPTKPPPPGKKWWFNANQNRWDAVEDPNYIAPPAANVGDVDWSQAGEIMASLAKTYGQRNPNWWKSYFTYDDASRTYTPLAKMSPLKLKPISIPPIGAGYVRAPSQPKTAFN